VLSTITKISLLIVLFLTGCGGTPKPTISVKEKATPKWFLNPPQSTSSTLYSIGEGESRQDAISDALNNMVSTLSVSIKSQFQSSSKTANYNGIETYSKHTKNNITANVKELRISNYKILNSEKLAFDSYIVLISANKADIFNSLKDEVDKKLSLLSSQEKAEVSDTALNQLKFYKNATKEANNLLYKSVILKVLNPSFNDNYIVKAIAHYQNAYTKIRGKISFTIGSNQTANDLKPVIKDALNSNNLKVASGSGKYHFDLFIASHINYSYAYGFIIARAAITITVTDYKKETISTKKLNITGQSTQSKKIAKEDIAYKLSNLIKKSGIKTILDIDL
jgi:hypothetical protein